jgi:DNA-binding protein HU-beta
MTKADLVTRISKSTHVDETEVLLIVESFMATLKDSLTKNENVYLRGFGTFEVKHRAEKIARNISQGTNLIVPAHNVPAFKPSKVFEDKIDSAVK